LLYYITDRSQFPGVESQRRRALLDKIAEAIACGVDYIQLREKDLAIRDLEDLARQAVKSGERERKTVLLLNSRTDVAIAVGAGGVHLRSNDLSVSEVRAVLSSARAAHATVAVSCHAPEQVKAAAGADFVVFGPVFEKGIPNPCGLEHLHEACGFGTPVLALGGVTVQNARLCIQAGAAGVAGIRLFQSHPVADVVMQLQA